MQFLNHYHSNFINVVLVKTAAKFLFLKNHQCYLLFSSSYEVNYYRNIYFMSDSQWEIIISSNVQSQLKWYKIFGNWCMVLKI